MVYRRLGTSGLEVSQLGFGCMRFPLKDENDFSSIDEMLAGHMLRYAIDRGVNYLDTAYNYHRGASETFLGKIIPGGVREKILLATKMPVWLVKSATDPGRLLDEQLTRLRTDRIDLYLLHGLNRGYWDTVKKFELLNFLSRMIAAGKIRYAGFSFHDDIALFREIIDSYHWILAQIHLNYVDNDIQAGLDGLAYAASRGIGVVIMEPLRGGKLVRNPPPDVQTIIDRTVPAITPAEYAFRYLWHRPEVSTVLCGMNTIEQVDENIRCAERDHIGTLTDQDLEDYRSAKEIYKSKVVVGCTACGYCLPCAQKIPISFILEIYNDAFMYNALAESRGAYRSFLSPERRADKCTACGECEAKCPQGIPIAETLAEAHKALFGD